MNITLNIAVNEETLSALNALTAALLAAQGTTAPAAAAASKPASKPAAKAPAKAKEEADGGPVYWADNIAGTFGVVDTLAAYDELKADNENVIRIPESKHDELVKAKKAEEAAAKKAATEKKKPAAPSAKPEKGRGFRESQVTKKDLVEAFSEYLPRDLDASERDERRAFVTALLQRFGATKVSLMGEEHWSTAIDLVQRKMAGEDIDPEAANFGIAEEESDEDDDLV